MTEVLGVLCSGRGTNLESIIAAVNRGDISASVGVVLSDKPNVKALELAGKTSIPNFCINRSDFKDKESFEKVLIAKLREYKVSIIILAGFMRILSKYFIREFSGRILNIHQSLLPSFSGAHAHRDVIAYGAKVSGCTVHFVDEGIDSGTIILQAAVPVLENDNEETLTARVLVEEHKIYPQAISLFVNGKLKIEGRKVRILD